MEVKPPKIGVVSMSLGSTTDCKVNFCKIVVRNKNSSMQVRPSPTQPVFLKITNTDSTYSLNTVFLAIRKRLCSSNYLMKG